MADVVKMMNALRGVASEEYQNRVPIVMMSKTVHQLYHNDELFYVHPNQVFGKWTELIKNYQGSLMKKASAIILTTTVIGIDIPPFIFILWYTAHHP